MPRMPYWAWPYGTQGAVPVAAFVCRGWEDSINAMGCLGVNGPPVRSPSASEVRASGSGGWAVRFWRSVVRSSRRVEVGAGFITADGESCMDSPVASAGQVATRAALEPASRLRLLLGERMLVVDDSYAFRERVARAFRERGFQVRTAANYSEAIVVAAEFRPDLAVVDLRMPGESGLRLIRELKQLHEPTRVLILSGFGSIATAIDAVRLGAVNFLPKPADADDILAAFERGQLPVAAPVEMEPETPSLARAEWEHIHRVLADCGGNVSEAARRLGIHRRSLQRKLRKHAPE